MIYWTIVAIGVAMLYLGVRLIIAAFPNTWLRIRNKLSSYGYWKGIWNALKGENATLST